MHRLLVVAVTTVALSFIALSFVARPASAWATSAMPGPCVAAAVSSVDLERCQQAELNAANRDLNDVYQARQDAASGDARERFRKEQRAWIVQRDRECIRAAVTSGSTSMAIGRCLLERTRERTREIAAMPAP